MQLEDSTDAIIEALALDSPDNRILLAETMLGEDAMEFMTSDLGRYLIGRVNQDRGEAYFDLAKTPWWRKRKIVQLQQRIEMTEALMTYFREIILSGKSALAELDKRNQTGES
jgi:hypothetical protein